MHTHGIEWTKHAFLRFRQRINRRMKNHDIVAQIPSKIYSMLAKMSTEQPQEFFFKDQGFKLVIANKKVITVLKYDNEYDRFKRVRRQKYIEEKRIRKRIKW